MTMTMVVEGLATASGPQDVNVDDANRTGPDPTAPQRRRRQVHTAMALLPYNISMIEMPKTELTEAM